MKYLICVLALLMSDSIWAQSMPLSQIVAQSGGGPNARVVINANEVVHIDRSVEVGELIINGMLYCSSTAEIKANTIVVNGTLSCGTQNARFNNKITFSLKHSHLDPRTNPSYRGFLVNGPGKLLLFGNTGRSGHTKLNALGEKGSSVLTLAVNVTNRWQVGDEIVIAPTSYYHHETEKRVITAVNGTQVRLDRPLSFRHWGSLQTLRTQRGNVVMDQRAEVANLTRNIVIRGDESYGLISDSDIPGGQWGAHVMVNRGGFAQVDSVEFTKVGQAGVMARYPFHWHFAQNVSGQFIKNSAIHASFQRCITIHQTQKSVVENNVCYDFRGHGFFLEDGNETDNLITKNLGIQSRYPLPSRVLLASDNTNAPLSGVVGNRFPPTAIFWISHPQNTITENIAAGGIGVGFWQAYVPEVRQFDRNTGEFSGAVIATPVTSNTTAFDNNVAHTNLVGFTWDGAPAEMPYQDNSQNPFDMNNPNNPQDRRIEITHYRPQITPVVKGLVGWKNLYAGLYYRGQTMVFENFLMADNGWSMFLAYNQILRNGTFVGRSANFGPAEEEYFNAPRDRQAGLILYDGPWEMNNVDFLDFDTKRKDYTKPDGELHEITNTPLWTIGGSEKFTNISRQIRMAPEPLYRAYMSPLEGPGAGWVDETQTNNLIDRDGTLTGVVGAKLIPAGSFFQGSGCRNHGQFVGMQICPANTSTITLNLGGNKNETFGHTPYIIRRSDNTYTLPKGDWGVLDSIGNPGVFLLQRKAVLLANAGLEYEVLLKPEVATFGHLNDLTAKVNAPVKGTTLPMTQIKGLGSNCRMDNSRRYGSKEELRAGAQDGYYSQGNEFFIKLTTTALIDQIKQGSGESQESVSGAYFVKCAEPTINAVTGYVDQVFRDDKGGVLVAGWACDYGKRETTSVHFYVGESAGRGGTMIGAADASAPSEEAVNFACADPSMTGHRFVWKIPQDQLLLHAGKPLYVHGISTSGKDNHVIGNSGNFRIPGSLSGEIAGHLDLVNTAGVVAGWACQQNVSAPIQVELYTGTNGPETLLTTITANRASEAGVSSICGTQGVPHRFQWTMSEQQLRAGQGKKIYVLGVPLTGGKAKRAIANSGHLALFDFSIKGHVDSVANGYVHGWACDQGRQNQVGVHIYLNAPAGQPGAVFAGAADANIVAGDNEGIASASVCNDSSKLGHRFQWKIPNDVLAQRRGQKIFIHGLSVSNESNSLITRSGVFAIP